MKKALAVVVGVCLLALGGCGVNSAKVADKATKAADTIKSGQAVITMSTTANGNTQQTIDGGTFTLKPQVITLNQSNQNQQTTHYYFVGNTLYFQMANKWYRQKVADNSPILQNTKRALTSASATDILKGMKSDLKAKSNKNTYTLSYSGNSSKAKKVAQKIIKAESGSKANTTSQYKVSHLTFSYTVNKKTYLPTKSTIKMKYTDGSKGATTSTVSGSYEDINKVKKVDVPAQVTMSSKQLPAKLAKALF